MGLLDNSTIDKFTDKNTIFIEKTKPESIFKDYKKIETIEIVSISEIQTDAGVEIDFFEDKVEIEDECTNIPHDYKIDNNRCAISTTLPTNFNGYIVELPINLDRKIIEASNYLKDNPTIKAMIIGHTSRTKSSNEEYNLQLSLERADRIRLELEYRGIDFQRLNIDGKGFEEPIANNSTTEGRRKNQRVEIQFYKQ